MAQHTRVVAIVVTLAWICAMVFLIGAMVYAWLASQPPPKGTYVLTNIDDGRLSQFGTVVFIEQPSVVDVFRDNIVVFTNISGVPGVAVVVSDMDSVRLKALVVGNLTPSALAILLKGSDYVHMNGEVVGVVIRSSVSIDAENVIRSALGLEPAKKPETVIVEGLRFSTRYVLLPTLAVATFVGILLTKGGDWDSPEATKSRGAHTSRYLP